MDSSDTKKIERITWLNYEFAQVFEQCEQGKINLNELASLACQITSHEELDDLGDELLLHTFWAMEHACHRPACWAPSPEEIAYLRRCLLGEDLFDAEQITFSPDTVKSNPAT